MNKLNIKLGKISCYYLACNPEEEDVDFVIFALENIVKSSGIKSHEMGFTKAGQVYCNLWGGNYSYLSKAEVFNVQEAIESFSYNDTKNLFMIKEIIE